MILKRTTKHSPVTVWHVDGSIGRLGKSVQIVILMFDTQHIRVASKMKGMLATQLRDFASSHDGKEMNQNFYFHLPRSLARYATTHGFKMRSFRDETPHHNGFCSRTISTKSLS